MIEPITDARLAEIESFAAAATSGPWGVLDREGEDITIAADLDVISSSAWTCRREIARFEEEPIDNDPAHRDEADWDWDDDRAQQVIDAKFIAAACNSAQAMAAEIRRSRAEARATQELLHALRLAVVTIRAAWVEARHVGPEEGIEVLEEIVLATAPDLPDLDQYDGAQAVFDAEYGAADRTTDAKKYRARLAAKEA